MEDVAWPGLGAARQNAQAAKQLGPRPMASTGPGSGLGGVLHVPPRQGIGRFTAGQSTGCRPLGVARPAAAEPGGAAAHLGHTLGQPIRMLSSSSWSSRGQMTGMPSPSKKPTHTRFRGTPHRDCGTGWRGFFLDGR